MSYSEDQQQEDKTIDKGLALGIDFGNSQISAAVWRPEKRAPDMLKFGNKSSFPATLYFSDLAEKHNLEAQQNEGEANESKIEDNPSDITPKVGEEFTNDKNIDYFVYDVKKYMGKNIDLEKIKGEVCYNITMDENGNFLCFDEKIPFEKMAKFFIEKVVNTAKEQFQKDVNCCTISVPHGFNNDQRTAVINAANEAGINEVYIINDPLSTGIYYISKNKLLNSEYFLIIDFGSSKLDITLLNISKHNSIRVKLSGGASEYGGDIFDLELLKEVKDTYKNEGGTIPIDPMKMRLLMKKVEEAKIKLTFQNEALIEEKKLDNKKELKYTIKRERFDELNKDNYNKIIKLIGNLIKESKIQKTDINHICLQGNSTRVVKLKERILEEFPDIDVCDYYNSIPMGAAIYTAKKLNQMGNVQFKNFKIYDITPLSLGIRAEGDLMSVIIPRGTKVPIKAEKYFITTQDNQTCIKFEIFAGERKLIKDNFLLKKIMLKNLPQANKGEVRILVTFEVDENFLLHIEAKELSTNISKRVEVFINESLSQSQILEKIEDAKKNEKQDLQEKERIQAMLRLNDKIFEYSHLYEGNEDILRELESYRNWIKHSATVPKEDYEQKLKELNENMQSEKLELKIRKQNNTKMNNINRNKMEEEKNMEIK
jgi:molecular chaperone DnaK (HSP70)